MSAGARDRAIDLVRGAVMVVMVLDHARDFFFGFDPDPTDLRVTYPTLFATRWITHFCAPGFVVLAGAAAHLSSRRKSPAELRRFLVTRGLWLIVLELTVVKLGFAPEPYHFVLLQVIWVIGLSMILIAPLVTLRRPVLAGIGIAMIALHGLFDAVSFEGPLRVVWAILHRRDAFEPIDGHTIVVGYPLVPWIGVMLLGFGLGALWERADRRRILTIAGVAMIAAFFALRTLNVYGDPVPWSVQADPALTVISFFDCEKYPPSLLYLLMTLGPLALLLVAFDRPALPALVVVPLEAYGRVPLFFYVLHLHLLRIPSTLLAFLRWGSLGGVLEHQGAPAYPLWSAYVAWIAALVILFPLCRWFGALKQRRAARWWWLRYL